MSRKTELQRALDNLSFLASFGIRAAMVDIYKYLKLETAKKGFLDGKILSMHINENMLNYFLSTHSFGDVLVKGSCP